MYFFDDPKNIYKLDSFIQEWNGTLYKHHTGVCGVGCDCIHFIVRGLEYFGFSRINVPWYPKDWHLHNTEERLLNGIRKHFPPHNELEPNNPKSGDIILYKFGKTISHAGWFLKGEVYQALASKRIESRIWLDREWHKRRRKIFRLLGDNCV